MDVNSRVRTLRALATELTSGDHVTEDELFIEFVKEFIALDQHLGDGGEWPWQWAIVREAKEAKSRSL